MNKKLLFTIVCIFSSILTCYAKHDVVVDGLYYNLSFDKMTASVVGREPSNIDVVIPAEISINGRKFTVNEIEDWAFDESGFPKDTPKSKKLRTVEIDENVKEIKIGGYAFSRCTNLKHLYLGENVLYVGYDCLYNSNVDYLEIKQNRISKTVFGRVYNAFFMCNPINASKINTAFLDIPRFEYNCDTNNLIISGHGNIPTFSGCDNKSAVRGDITNLIINADNKTIPCFFNDAKIKNFIVLIPNPKEKIDLSVDKSIYINSVLYVPDKYYEAYNNHEEWRRFINIRKFSEIESALSQEVKSKLRFSANDNDKQN